jgi:hypothetical protein
MTSQSLVKRWSPDHQPCALHPIAVKEFQSVTQGAFRTPPLPLKDVFNSHIEEDVATALVIAEGLEAAGYQPWYYERDSVPGPSYLLQTGDAIENAKVVVLIVSAHSLSSNQVTAEVVRGHESGKFFIPILSNITHVEF